MYKVASENAQRRVSRIQIADQMTERAVASLDDRYTALVRVIHSIEEELKDPLLTVERRVELGQRKQKIQADIKELRPHMNMRKRFMSGLSAYFLREAERVLPPFQFKSIMAAAKRDYDKEADALAQITGET